MKKAASLLPFLFVFLLVSCSSIPFGPFKAKDQRALLKLPEKIDQKAWYPVEESEKSYYHRQSLLYAELGSRFYNLKDYSTARDFFELSIKYDKRNRKALFALGILDHRDGEYEKAVQRLMSIPARDKKLFPYDIDYYEAGRMILAQLPIEGRVISLARNDNSAPSAGIVVANRGLLHGLKEGMTITVFRMGNPIRDFETLEVLGVQKTPIARLRVAELEERTSVCTVERIESGYFIQINDVIEVTFGGVQ